MHGPITSTREPHRAHSLLDKVYRHYCKLGVLKKNAKDLIICWTDGCGEQFKGRRNFRLCSEWPSKYNNCGLIWNMAASAHFGGPWDSEGGRQSLKAFREEMKGNILRDSSTVVKMLNEKMTDTKKELRRIQWNKSNSLKKDFTIDRRHFIVDNEIDRSRCIEAKPIPGTMTHYCYGFFSTPGKVWLRRLSCFCKYCTIKQYSLCPVAELVAAQFHDHYTPNNLRGGWHQVQMTFLTGSNLPIKLRSSALDDSRAFVADISFGDYIAVFCGSSLEKCTHLSFWIAYVEPRDDSSTHAVSPAKLSMPNLGIQKGEKVILVSWLERLDDYNNRRTFIKGGLQYISTQTIVPARIIWTRRTANRFYITADFENKLVQICKLIKESLKPK